MMEYWRLLIPLCLGGAGYAAYRAVSGRVRRLSRGMFGVDSLAQGLALQSEKLESTPKSVSGMTRLFLPQILADFPEFNLPEFIQRAENLLKATFLAIDRGDAAGLGEASPDYVRQVRLLLESHAAQGISEHYERVAVHQTEVARYARRQGTCVVTLQSAVGHVRYRERGGQLISGSRDRLEQTKYNLELVYVQDLSRTPDGASGSGLTCPNCGAPVKTLGGKRCEYCGGALAALNLRVWSFTRFSEV